MPKFQQKVEEKINKTLDKVLTREELDAKHQAGLEAKAIVAWKSPVRIYKTRSKNYFTKVGLWALIFILAAIAFNSYLLVGVIIALVFVVFVLALAAPETIEHKITNMGIVSGGRVFLWEELDSFWFEKKGEERLLVVQTLKRFPARLLILLSSTVSERALLLLLEKHLHYHPAPLRTLFDKWAQELQKRFSLE